jgi:hypothetical protein
MRSRSSLWRVSLLACSLAVSYPAAAQKVASPFGVSVFVGPQIREGFVDMDAGIRDSIRDIQQECQQAGFKVAATADKAELVLIVIGRGTLVKGDVGFASAVGGIGSGFVVPNSVPTITTSLRVGKYERSASREGSTWRNAAKNVAEDLTAWVEANKEILKQ